MVGTGGADVRLRKVGSHWGKIPSKDRSAAIPHDHSDTAAKPANQTGGNRNTPGVNFISAENPPDSISRLEQSRFDPVLQYLAAARVC